MLTKDFTNKYMYTVLEFPKVVTETCGDSYVFIFIFQQVGVC